MADYNVELDPDGILEGIFARDFACTLGMPCIMTLNGYNIDAGASLAVLQAGLCGAAAAELAAWSGLVFPPNVVSSDASSAVYNFGIPVTGAPGLLWRGRLRLMV